jgi:hypothetical protein
LRVFRGAAANRIVLVLVVILAIEDTFENEEEDADCHTRCTIVTRPSATRALAADTTNS